MQRDVWSRLIAGLVDYALATVAAVLLIWPCLGTFDRLRLDPLGFATTECDIGPLSAILSDQIGQRPTISTSVCQTQVLRKPQGGIAAVYLDGMYREGHATVIRARSVDVAEDGAPVTPIKPQSPITALLLIVVGGLLIRRTGQIPGKCLMGLKVTGPTPLPGLQREALKLRPLLLLLPAFAAVAVPFVGPKLAIQWPLTGFLTRLAVAYSALPLLQGQHATRYDHWPGLAVTRS